MARLAAALPARPPAPRRLCFCLCRCRGCRRLGLQQAGQQAHEAQRQVVVCLQPHELVQAAAGGSEME